MASHVTTIEVLKTANTHLSWANPTGLNAAFTAPARWDLEIRKECSLCREKRLLSTAHLDSLMVALLLPAWIIA